MKSQILQRLEPSEAIEQLERLEQALTSKEAVMESNVIQQRVPIHGDPDHWIHVSDSPRQLASREPTNSGSPAPSTSTAS